MATTRIYVIENKDDQTCLALVEATSRAQALAYMSRSMFDARPASGKDVADAIRHGLEVKVAKDEPEQAQVPVVQGVNLPPGVLPQSSGA